MISLRRTCLVLLALFVLSITGQAAAEVLREGTWPARDPKVTLSFDNVSRSEAIKRLAEKANWSVVVEIPASTPVDIHVKDQPATKVLELLLSDGRYLAKRDGDLISISKATEAASPAGAADSGSIGPPVADAQPTASEPPPAAAPAPVAAPAPSAATSAEEPPQPPKRSSKRGEDRVVTGGSTRIESSEVVHDLVVMGGSAEVFGTVTGDITVMGGSAKLRKGARVEGDAAVIGGSLDVDEGASIDGDVGAVGGNIHRGDKQGMKLSLSDVDDKAEKATRGFLGFISDVGAAITRSALLFVFGAVLLALVTGRMESMQGEVAARPMRTFALGVVGSLICLVSFVALCVTIVGIPIAILALAALVFGAYAGICAVLTTTGAALVHHKSKSAYVHLAVGCAAFLVLGNLPWIGGFVTLAVILIGLGALFATRGAGVFARKDRNNGPYRTAHP